jgi:hypothetical protein
VQGADFIGVMGALLLRSQSQFSAYGIDSKEDPVTLPHLAAQSQMQSGADWSGTGYAGHVAGISST